MADPIEDFLNRLHHPMLASIDLSLDRMYRLLGVLGNPQKRLPPVIHVAGTNGKGSLLAYLTAIFEAAGLRVHRYTSPHLVHFRERILLAGQPIDDNNLFRILKYLAPIIQSQPATFFEATTAAAFLAFAEKQADVLLLETGLGGRLDATNVIAKPLLTAITPISFDHTEYLGTTIEKIAGEKAGIIKKDVPCVIGRQDAVPLAVLEKKAKELGAPMYRMGQEWRVENHRFHSAKRDIALNPALAGEYQFDNAATAVACIDQLSFAITDEHIASGLAAAVWPARLEHLTAGKLPAMLPSGIQLWLDGGHNPQGGQVLGEWLVKQQLEVTLICGMIKGKDMKAFLSPLAPHVTRLYGVTIRDEVQSQPGSAVAEAARSLGLEAAPAESIQNALQSAAQHAKTPSIICICGSLYLAGKVLAINGEK